MITLNKNYIVTKSNKLITCNYDLSLQEQKIILTLASMVQPADTEFKEYEFTADNLGLFNGYVIKIVMSGTNQAYPPRIKELRTIAVR